MHRKAGTFASLVGLDLARREIFDHEVMVIPKPYPDAQLLLEQRGLSRALLASGEFLQLNVYTTDFFGLPDELFADPEINWHHQQFGRKGLIAAAGLWIKDSTLTISTLQSDLCQQLYRHPALRRSCKTQVETHFKYWYAILFNAVLDFCLDQRISFIYSPIGRQVVAGTRTRIAPDLFLRIYDHPARVYGCSIVRHGRAEHWKIPVAANADRVGRLSAVDQVGLRDRERPRICLFHDIEENVDAPVSAAECAANLSRMLEIEKAFGFDATYNVLGTIFNRKREEIRSFNPHHAFAFHSYDHDLDRLTQLQQCREVDLRVRGYRPPKSKITEELTDYDLTFFNFEWLASGASSLRRRDCVLQHGIVKLPIHLDDFPLHTRELDYASWETDVLAAVPTVPMYGLSLHDCYASHWLDQYPRLLDRLGAIGDFVTADAICDRVLLDGPSMVHAAPACATRPGLLQRIGGWFAS